MSDIKDALFFLYAIPIKTPIPIDFWMEAPLSRGKNIIYLYRISHTFLPGDKGGISETWYWMGRGTDL